MMTSRLWLAVLVSILTFRGFAAPEIAVAGNWSEITDGDVSPSTANGTNLGDAYFGDSASLGKTSWIQVFNVGDQNLLLTSGVVVFVGAHADDYVFFAGDAGGGDNFTTNIPPGGVSILTLRCNPTAPGARDAVVYIYSNDSDEGVFDFAITANGVNGPSPSVPDFVMRASVPVIKEKVTDTGTEYRIKGYFTLRNFRATPNDGPFFVNTYLSFDPFYEFTDTFGLIESKEVKKQLFSPSKKSAKIKYKITTTTNPYGGAIIAVSDSGGDIAEGNENNNRYGAMINASAP